MAGPLFPKPKTNGRLPPSLWVYYQARNIGSRAAPTALCTRSRLWNRRRKARFGFAGTPVGIEIQGAINAPLGCACCPQYVGRALWRGSQNDGRGIVPVERECFSGELLPERVTKRAIILVPAKAMPEIWQFKSEQVPVLVRTTARHHRSSSALGQPLPS